MLDFMKRKNIMDRQLREATGKENDNIDKFYEHFSQGICIFWNVALILACICLVISTFVK